MSDTVLPLNVPVLAVTVPLLAKVTLYVVPLHTALPAVSIGALPAGEAITTVCIGQSGVKPSIVIVTSVPTGMPLI